MADPNADPNKDENTQENNRGQDDASSGRMPHEPWARPFESTEHYQERRDSYNAGFDNATEKGPFDTE